MNVCNSLVKINNAEYYTDKIERILKHYESQMDYDLDYGKFIHNLPSDEFINRYMKSGDDMFKEFDSAFLKRCGFSFGSSINKYVQLPVANEMLNTSIEEINKNRFYRALFNAMGVSLEQVENAYKMYNQTVTPAFLSELKNECMEKLKGVEEKFNKLFMFSSTPYEFDIEFERSGGIYFTIYRSKKPQVLDLQSTGFRYFFDLFFNFLNTTALKSGDIIIMDEPAMNLHVKGQREIRKFLKEFAIRNDILIIVATHSPFMIDLDDLDDLRCVVSDGMISRIENNFSAVDPADPDSLLPIKNALTVENYMLVNPKETVVFVQTMEDYCYLVAFKKLLGIKDISILPVNGISNDAESCKKVANCLKNIRSDAFILVNDDEAGKCMKDVCKESDFTVLTLSSVDKRFSIVSSLFADGDKPRESASTFKTYIDEYKVNDESRENFKKLFDYLKSESE